MIASGALLGCTQHVVYFPKPTVPVRLGEDMKAVTVYVQVDNEWVPARANLYAGQYILTLPSDWDEAERRAFQNTQLKAPTK